MKAKFYICEHCGNLITTIHNAGVPLVCCGEKMKELLPNTVEASGEKHLPVAQLSGSTLTVTVGTSLGLSKSLSFCRYFRYTPKDSECGHECY